MAQPRRSAAHSARRQEQPKYLYSVTKDGKHVKYLSARGLVRARQELKQYADSKGLIQMNLEEYTDAKGTVYSLNKL